MKRLLISALFLLNYSLFPAQAAEIRVLSAGAVEPGMHAFKQLVQRELGHDLKIQFNTAPQIAKRLAADEFYDILVSPPAVIDQALKDGKLVADGRVFDWSRGCRDHCPRRSP